MTTVTAGEVKLVPMGLTAVGSLRPMSQSRLLEFSSEVVPRHVPSRRMFQNHQPVLRSRHRVRFAVGTGE